MRDWLAAQGWDDVFLNLDPSVDVAPRGFECRSRDK
jgi:hypothetical protein